MIWGFVIVGVWVALDIAIAWRLLARRDRDDGFGAPASSRRLSSTFAEATADRSVTPQRKSLRPRQDFAITEQGRPRAALRVVK